MLMDAKNLIAEGKSYLGIEFGSTRIKGVVIDEAGNVLATGGHGWGIRDSFKYHLEMELELRAWLRSF